MAYYLTNGCSYARQFLVLRNVQRGTIHVLMPCQRIEVPVISDVRVWQEQCGWVPCMFFVSWTGRVSYMGIVL